MQGVALAASALLAVVFAVAAAAKFADQPGTRRALADFGMPARSLKLFGWLLPLTELAIAIALLFGSSARWGAVAALALLGAFVVAIARVMARGEAPECHCFGQISSSPVGTRTLIRNALLAIPAIFIVAYGPGEGIDTWLSHRSSAELVALGAVALAIALGVVCLRLWRANRHVSQDLARANEALAAFPAGLPIGAPAPSFSLPADDGQTVTLESLIGRGKPVALVFISPGCSACVDMFEDLARWQTALADRVTIALLGSGDKGDLWELTGEHGLTDVLVQDEAEVFNAYRAAATPSVVIVGPDGTIASLTRSTQVLIETLVRRAVHTDAARRPAASNGAPFEVRQWSNVADPTGRGLPS